MAANTFGDRFCVTTFGESHGPAMGVVIDGCPAGVRFDEALLLREIARRRPGGATVSSRAESDAPEILSGVFEGKTLGTPIALVVRNQDARSADYAGLAPRAGHADDVWREKFGHSDPRGGGRSSGRETLCRVMAGAVAQMLLAQVAPELRVSSFASRIGPLALRHAGDRSAEVEALLLDAKAKGLSYGGVADVRIENCPAGLGQPVFHKLKADLAAAWFGVGSTSAVELGEGAEAALAEGSEFHRRAPEASPYGGVRGGISTGELITARVSFKPTSSVLDVAKQGRHDPCIVPRALPVLESMAWLVLADHWLWARTDRV